MCNYYGRHRPSSELQRAFGFVDPLPNQEPRYVVRPTDTERVVAIGKDGARHFPAMRWGLVPYWANDTKTGLTLFNARAETLLEKKVFAEPFNRGRRCLIPVDGFFEFTGPKGAKQPHYFKPKDDRIMAFAGLWESWRGPKDAPLPEPLLSYTLITTTPNTVAAPIHNRMPVLLAESAAWDAWLDPKSDSDGLLKMLTPAPDELLEVYPVTRELLRRKELDASVLAPVALA
jgi:putative SOS response-associated peptidase YedK